MTPGKGLFDLQRGHDPLLIPAFSHLREAFLQTPVLALPDFDQPFILYTIKNGVGDK